MYDLERFVKAQNHNYQDALEEIRNGRKKSCWMWYVFPQISGLGRSAMAKKYELQSLAEAKAYLDHPILSTRLQEICEAALVVDCSDAGIVFGSPDDLKKCYGKSKQGYKTCPVCGKKFPEWERSLKICCSKECSKKNREEMYKRGVYSESIDKMRKGHAEKKRRLVRTTSGLQKAG